MKAIRWASIILLGVSGVCLAQNKPADDTHLPPVQAPPNIHDPGVVAKSSVDKPAGKQQVKKTTSTKREPASPGLPPEVQAKANIAELPVVTVRQRGSERVEEYREHGKLVFVRVLSKKGPTKLYVDDPSAIPPSLMKKLTAPSGTVQPVYYKLYEWK